VSDVFRAIFLCQNQIAGNMLTIKLTVVASSGQTHYPPILFMHFWKSSQRNTHWIHGNMGRNQVRQAAGFDRSIQCKNRFDLDTEAEYPHTWFPFAWRHVEREYSEILGPAIAMSSPKSQMRICELVWRGNNFALHAWDLPFLSAVLSIVLRLYFSTRVYERSRWERQCGGKIA